MRGQSISHHPIFVSLAVVGLSEIVAIEIPGINQDTIAPPSRRIRRRLVARMLDLLRSLPWRSTPLQPLDERRLARQFEKLIEKVVRQPTQTQHPLLDLQEQFRACLETLEAA